ncbi:MAG: ATP-binding cassette domain-containing protein, partial [Planctomycetia bacterium]
MNSSSAAVEVSGLSHRYRDRQALVDVSLTVARGAFFALLGPNGGGKSTLFRILNTATAIQSGRAYVLGVSLADDPQAVRGRLGVVFQNPSLDKKLTVAENLRHHGRLY